MKIKFNKSSALTTCASSAILLASLLASQGAGAHGYLDVPPSRALLCQRGVNTQCGDSQYEPHSVGETFKGYPAGVGGSPLQGPVDGQIPSGSNPRFSGIDAQSATRWQLTEIKERTINFEWQYTAAHPATKHEYFITRNGWNPNQPLTRAQFESTPFCVIEGHHTPPVPGAKHSCTIPGDKSGQHIILAIWTVGDTDMAFHNVADVNIMAEADLPGGWSGVGSIGTATPLLVGDKVKARAFSATGEKPDYSVEISIDNAQEGAPENWSFKLAEKINQSQTLIRAGIRNESGEIEPIRGNNTIYAQKESGVVRYEVQLDMKDDAAASLELGSIKPEYVLEKGRATLDFSAVSNRKMNVEATLYDEANAPVGTVKDLVDSGSKTLKMDVLSSPGKHNLTLIGTTLDGRTARQDTQNVTLTGEGPSMEYDFVFPQGLEGYKAGTKVLQPKTGEIFECKSGQEAGYCKQYKPDANGFEPGVGAHWHMGWNKL